MTAFAQWAFYVMSDVSAKTGLAAIGFQEIFQLLLLVKTRQGKTFVAAMNILHNFL